MELAAAKSNEIRELTDAELEAVNGGALHLVGGAAAAGAAFGLGLVGTLTIDYAINGDDSAIVKLTNWLDKVV
jgi:lactobin A/cerein 7B family class IIb bacteriocin